MPYVCQPLSTLPGDTLCAMQRWDYLDLVDSSGHWYIDGKKSIPARSVALMLKQLGADGWELVGLTAAHGNYVFKRPL